MTNSPSIYGIIAYPVTPFAADGDDIDTGKLATLVDRLVTDGAHAIAPLGSTGAGTGTRVPAASSLRTALLGKKAMPWACCRMTGRLRVRIAVITNWQSRRT